MTAAILVPLIMISSKSFAEEYKFGYVAIQKAVIESAAGKDAMAKFQKEVKEIEDTILKEKAGIEKLGEVLQKQSMMLTDSVRREKEKDYIRKQRDYERQVKDSKSEVQLKEAELTNDILEDLLPVIQKYGKDNGYTIVFEKMSATSCMHPIQLISQTRLSLFSMRSITRTKSKNVIIYFSH